MIKEYYKFIKDYLNLAEIKTKYLIINMLSSFFYKGFSLIMPLIASLIIKYLMENNSEMTFLYLIIFAIVFVLYNIALYINYKIYGFTMNYCYDGLQTKILNKLLTVDHNFTKFISKGRLMNSINTDIIDIGDMNDRISELLIGLLQIIGLFVIVAFYNIYLATILLIFTLIYIAVRNSADRNINIYHQKVVVQDDKYSTLLTQIISGLQEIKTFNMLPKLINKLNLIQSKFTKYYVIKRKYYIVRDNDVKVIDYFFKCILYVILIFLVANGNIGVNILILIIAYQSNIVSYIEDLISSTSTIRETNVSVNRINDILNYNSETITFGNLNTTDVFGGIEFKNTSLTINKNEILKNINMKIDHNTAVAIVGEAGSGKTMMFNLMLRLLKPNRGTIKIDNINIFEFDRDIYSKSISIVNQKPFIFNMSIRNNLNFADENIENQIEACKRAGIHDFIMTLPNGYNTVLRENANNISGGQKQMISIARTILTDAEILLLDDITTSLDPDTAQLVPRLIKNLKKDHTIIMITKKPDLMKCADRIIVLDKGNIVGDGTHNILIKENEIYQTLQSRKSPSRIGVFDDV